MTDTENRDEASAHLIGAALAALDAQELAATFSHDLCSPLTTIDISAEMLRRRGHLDDVDRAMVTRILKNSQNMTRRIQQFQAEILKTRRSV